MRHLKRANVLVFLAFLLAIVGQLGYQAFVSPAVQFLLPATRGQWIVHPAQPTGYGKALFAHRFSLPVSADSYLVRIAAMRECEITVNGQSLPKASTTNWKYTVQYNLGPVLRVGDNEIRIHVSNPEAPPALLVEGPEIIRSDERWTVELPLEGTSERHAAVADHGEDFLAAQPNALRASPHFGVWAAGFVLYCLFIAYALIPRRLKPWMTSNRETERARAAGAFRKSHGPCLALFAVVAVIQLRNVSVYPSASGFDAEHHAAYVQYVAEHWQVPSPTQGFEMAQPPLYYVLSAGIYNLVGGAARQTVALKAVQLVSPLAALATIAVAWWMLNLLYPTHARMRTLGFVVVALLPMMFYMSPQITNEVLAALVIGTTMCLAVRQIIRGDVRWRDAVSIGIGCGLGLLSKYTGLFVFASVLSLVGLRVITAGSRAGGSGGDSAHGYRWQLRHLAWASLLAAIALTMSSWLYVRNAKQFGSPFIGAWDRRSGFNIVQPPGYRTLSFYTRFGSVFWQQIGHARFSGFWDGMYGSMWADTHGVFLKPGVEKTETLSSLCLWLALLPTVAILLGFSQAVRRLLTPEWDHPYFVLVVTTVLTVTAILSFTMEHPFYSILKAHWALSLAPCVGVFAAQGLETMCEQLGRLRWLLYANLVILGGLVLYLFWYRGP